MTDDNNNHDRFRMFIPDRPANHPSRRGRPKGAFNERTIVKRLAFEKHKSRDRNGKVVTLTTIEAVIMVLQQAAMVGNHRAAAIRDRHFACYLEPDAHEGEAHGVMLAPGDMSPEDWIGEQEQHNARIGELMEEIKREEGA